MKDRASKLKTVDTKDPVALRKQFEETNNLLRMTGNPLSEKEISRLIELHCDEGVPLEECVERMMAE